MMDPSMMAAPLPEDPMAGGLPPEAAPPSPYPTTDPMFVDQLLGQLMEARNQDHQALEDDQSAAVQQSQMMQALLGGAPMGPGAGADAQAIGFDPSMLPDLPTAQ